MPTRFISLTALLVVGHLSTTILAQRPPQSRPLPSTPLPEQRSPPPIQNEDVVQALIDDLMKGNVHEAQVDNQKPATATDDRKHGPMKFVNSSPYWNTQNLQPEATITDRKLAQDWLDGYLKEARKLLHMATTGGWNYFTNLTDHNRDMLVQSEEVLGSFLKSTAIQAKQFDLSAFASNATLQRLLHMLGVEGMSALPDAQFKEFNELKSMMAHAFTNGAVCEKNRPPPCTLRYPDLQALMATSRDPGQLLHAWIAWRAAVGLPQRAHFWRHIDLSNQGARLNGFVDAGALWRSPYEMTAPTLGRGAEVDLKQELNRIYEQIKPFYTQLHAYVRRKISQTFGNVQALTSDGPIPAHLLGSLHADSWTALYFDSIPFPRHGGNDLSADPFANSDPIGNELAKLNYTVEKMFKQAESFYTSMGFAKLPLGFWQKSLLVRPWDRDVLCHPPTAFALRMNNDYRVKICAQVSQPDFIGAHRLLAQTYYQISHSSQPLPFSEAANPSFSSAVAEAMALASENNNYLKSLGVSTSKTTDTKMAEEKHINRLFADALDHIVGIPYALVVDLWRWKAYEGAVDEQNATTSWWMLRHDYQGIGSPVLRNDASDFDPPTSPVISQQHYPAVRKLIAYVMQFQLLRQLCTDAGLSPSSPLSISFCNLANSKPAGSRLQEMMSLGSSKPWPQVLKVVTGSELLDASALLEYYKPLYDWLVKENTRSREKLGWNGVGTPFVVEQGAVPHGGKQPHEGEMVNSNDVVPHMPARDKVAFPGEPCNSGETCIQQSTCNGTQCVCEEGMIRFQEHCLPSDPSFVGFGPNRPQINIIQGADPSPEPEHTAGLGNGHRATGAVGKGAAKLNSFGTFFLGVLVAVLLVVR